MIWLNETALCWTVLSVKLTPERASSFAYLLVIVLVGIVSYFLNGSV